MKNVLTTAEPYLLFALFFTLGECALAGLSTAALHPVGRAFRTDGKFGMLWSASGATFAVTGTTSVHVKVSAPKDGARLRVEINGCSLQASTLDLEPSFEGNLLVASKLNQRIRYELRLLKVTEDASLHGEQGVLYIHGVQVSPGGKVMPASSAGAARRLEFIGDSDTGRQYDSASLSAKSLLLLSRPDLLLIDRSRILRRRQG